MVFHGSLSCGCFLFSGYFGGYVRGFRGSGSSPFSFEMGSIQFTGCQKLKNMPRQLKCKHIRIRIQTQLTQ